MELKVTVRKKIATPERAVIVRDNADYTVLFDLDNEWSGLSPMMLVVCPDGTTYMRDITDNKASLPALRTDWVMIDLAAGDIRTTTGAMFRCIPSVRTNSTTHEEPPEDVYAQLLEMYQSKVSEPATDGTAGQVLATDGKGGRYWTNAGTGGATFATDETLSFKDGVLSVNTAKTVEKDNTLPVTSAAVEVVVGNIGAILDTI